MSGHVHRCDCGDLYVCSQNRDKCPSTWTCPACETEQLDDYFRQAGEARDAADREQPRLNLEPTHADHR